MIYKKSNDVDVSVIVPLFHGAKYINNLLQMIKKNSESARYIKIELVLVNDSPDDVPICPQVMNENFTILFISNKENLGIQRARLCGVEHSSGEYLLILDQDDEISDDAIEKLYNAVQSGDIAVSDWSMEVPCGQKIGYKDFLVEIKHFSLRRLSYGSNVVGPPGHCLIKRDCLPSCWKNIIMKINGADDYYMWIGMLAEKRKFVHCDGKLYLHKYHDNCFSNDDLNMLKSKDEAFKLAADEYKISFFWRWVHARSVRLRILWVKNKYIKNSRFMRRILLVLYPEQLLFRVMEKMGIYI